MLLHYGLVKVLRVEAYVQGTIRFMGYVRDDTNLVVWETGAMTPLSTMSLRVYSICCQYSMGTFHQVCWTWRMEESVLKSMSQTCSLYYQRSWGRLASR